MSDEITFTGRITVTDEMVEAALAGFVAEGLRISGSEEPPPSPQWYKTARPMLRAALVAALSAS